MALELLLELLDSTSEKSPEIQEMAPFIHAIARLLFGTKARAVKDSKRGKEAKFFGVAHERSRIKDPKGKPLMLTFDNSTDSGEFEINSLLKLDIEKDGDIDLEIKKLFKEFQVKSKKKMNYVMQGDRYVLREIHLGKEINELTVAMVEKLLKLLSNKPEKVEEAMTSGEIVEFIKKETRETQNSDHPAGDRAYARAIDDVIKKASKADLKFAQEQLNAAIKEGSFGTDTLTPAAAGKVWGKFAGWRAAVKFLGGKLPKDVESASYLDDLWDIKPGRVEEAMTKSFITEADFNLILDWFSSTSGGPQMADYADKIKERMPGVQPWTWKQNKHSLIKKLSKK